VKVAAMLVWWFVYLNAGGHASSYQLAGPFDTEGQCNATRDLLIRSTHANVWYSTVTVQPCVEAR
jgi:hypothetical protein